MAKPNYAFAKRQRELARKQKKEDKLKRKAEQATQGETTGPDDAEGSGTGADRTGTHDVGQDGSDGGGPHA